jgi:hypothetical protein
MDGSILDKVKEEKDLGVIMDDQLKFHTHVSAAVSKANQILGIINRTFVSLDEETLPIVYKCQVRPLLEYGNVIWNARFIADIKKVEGVQRRATKTIPSLQDKKYQERLKILKLYSMEYRRKRGDMIQVYKLLHDIDRVEKSIFFTMSLYTRTRGHSKKKFKGRCETTLRKHSFSQRIIDDWNSLTEDIVTAESINSFKAKLDKHWQTEWYKISTEE